MRTYKSESNIKPNELDINVDTVYHNYNVVEKTREREEGISETYFEYDVDEYTVQEYIQDGVATNKQLIDDVIVALLGE